MLTIDLAIHGKEKDMLSQESILRLTDNLIV